jgi:nitrate/nitrite-specific signal transduction histidine kinase
MASFCIGIIILIFLLSSFVIVRPLKKIAAAAEAFNKGSANYEVDIRSKDEIGDLAANLNRIFSDLKKTRLDMESYAKNLEEKITKRTKELELRNIRQSQANEKLENINKLMVGRELRMIELKKELEKERKLLNEKK